MGDKVNVIEQQVVEVSKDGNYLQVLSGNEKMYWVKCSDIVKMTMHPKPLDTAVIKTFPQKWLVVDIIPYVEPPRTELQELMLKDINNELTTNEKERLKYLQENDEDFKQQLADFDSLVEDY